ncbi:MAG: hypothetical protein ABIE75_02030 [Candidatus Omnitrophota bacterium]
MKDTYSKKVIKKVLKGFGLEARDIPRKSAKTPDFEVIGENSRYILEFKIKGDDIEEIKKDRKKLDTGEIVGQEISTGPRNRLYAVIAEGVRQINEYDPGHNTFHILWLHSSGRNDHLLNMRFHATLFGTQDLFSLGKKDLMTCYFFHESSFYSHQNALDGVILTYKNKLQLCVNTLSPHYKDFIKSNLYLVLSAGLCDPRVLERKEEAMIADCDVDRKKSGEMLNFLKNKYSLEHLQTIDMKQISAMIAVPKEN